MQIWYILVDALILDKHLLVSRWISRKHLCISKIKEKRTSIAEAHKSTFRLLFVHLHFLYGYVDCVIDNVNRRF